MDNYVEEKEMQKMAAISNDWLQPLSSEFKKDYYRKLYQTVKHEYETRKVFPAPDDIFNAFAFTPLADVKVVILGQDPYHNDGQAHGLCFSVKPDVEIPPSLVNIYQELHDDLGCYIPNNGYLKKWADQGVMLLNTVLTVRAHQANSHHDIGWEEFTNAAIKILNEQDRPMVFDPLGQAGPVQEAHVKQSKAHDPGSAPSQSPFRVPWIFWPAGRSVRPMPFLKNTA